MNERLDTLRANFHPLTHMNLASIYIKRQVFFSLYMWLD